MVLSIGLLGKSGKMGQAVLSAIEKNPAFQLTTIEFASVLIDFSHPSATLSHLLSAKEWNKPLLIGTTGLSLQIMEAIKQASLAIPILVCSNFSTGMKLCLEAVEQFSKGLDCTIDIIETHHIHKKDSPSGTALTLANAIDPAVRQKQKVRIQSIRSGEEIGEHRIVFECAGERIEIKHQALSREAFALGALKAAEFLACQPPGLYTETPCIKPSKTGS